MSESKAEYHKKQSEFQKYSDEPPSYTEATQQSNGTQDKNGGYLNDAKKELPSKQQIPQPNPNDPNINPNVYMVPPQLVDITRANPQHLNPAYPRYLERERERNMHGDFPNADRFKHGAPLNYSNVPKNNTMSKGFPGKAGATYNNAANK